VSGRSRESDAIRVHSEQAELFRDRYDALADDPYGSCFAYSRIGSSGNWSVCYPQPPKMGGCWTWAAALGTTSGLPGPVATA